MVIESVSRMIKTGKFDDRVIRQERAVNGVLIFRFPETGAVDLIQAARKNVQAEKHGRNCRA